MKYLALLYVVLGVSVFYMYQHREVRQPVVIPDGVNEKLWTRGRVIYQARCTACHNTNPDLSGSIGPKLRGVSSELLTERLTNGKGAMPAQKDMLRFVPAFREYLK